MLPPARTSQLCCHEWPELAARMEIVSQHRLDGEAGLSWPVEWLSQAAEQAEMENISRHIIVEHPTCGSSLPVTPQRDKVAEGHCRAALPPAWQPLPPQGSQGCSCCCH